MLLAMLADQMPQVEKQARTLIDEYDDAPPLVRASLYTVLIYTPLEHYKLAISGAYSPRRESMSTAPPARWGRSTIKRYLPHRVVAERVLQSLNARTRKWSFIFPFAVVLPRQ